MSEEIKEAVAKERTRIGALMDDLAFTAEKDRSWESIYKEVRRSIHPVPVFQREEEGPDGQPSG